MASKQPSRRDGRSDEAEPKRSSGARSADSPRARPDADEPHTRRRTIVGLGASAGGLSALKRFFATTPADTSLAFVVVVHLSPQHESHLAELLQPHVRMPVQQVTETVSLEPNRVYIIPPGANLDTIDTHLRLSKLEERRQERAPIDHFFRTLAAAHDGDAIGVILTGTGSDGTLGIKEIKQSGGLTIAQDPTEAEFDGMPQSAIASGQVDLVLPLSEIPAALARFAQVRPDVILMDLGMPKLDGYDAAGRIRGEPWGRDITLIALTGWSQERDRQRTREAGFDHHLVKPVDIEGLQRLLA